MASQPFEVEHNIAHFPTREDSPLIVSSPLGFTASELAHALFATGRAPWDKDSHGLASVWEWLHRTSVIPCYFRQEDHGELVMSDLGLELDRSERSALSYALGQAMANIFSRKQLDVPFLMHLDRYGKRHHVMFGPTRMRPDMIGWRPQGWEGREAGWVVVEAKGRLARARPGLRQHVQDQIRAVRTLGKPAQQPLWTYGTVSYFSYRSSHGLNRRNLCLEVITPPSYAPAPPVYPIWALENLSGHPDDREASESAHDGRPRERRSRRPEEEPSRPSHMDVNFDLFVQAYYEPFLAAIDHGEDVDSPHGDIRMATYPGLGLRVGMLRSIADSFGIARGERGTAGLSEDIMGALFDSRELPPGVFADGTIVQTPWDADSEPDSNQL